MPELEWAKRHTWQSWRERYRKNRERLDPVIDELVKKRPPPTDGKGLFPYDRRANKHRLNAFMRAQMREEDEDEDDDEEGEFRWMHSDEEEEGMDYDDYNDVPSGVEVPRRNPKRQTRPGPRERTASPAESRGRARTDARSARSGRIPPSEFDHDDDHNE